MELLKYSDVTPFVGQIWHLADSDGNKVAVVLEEAVEYPKYHVPTITQRIPFMLSFRGPKSPQLVQSTVDLIFPNGRVVEKVLIVPLQKPALYQAVFA